MGVARTFIKWKSYFSLICLIAHKDLNTLELLLLLLSTISNDASHKG